MTMLTADEALNVFAMSHIVSGGWINKTLGSHPAHLFITWEGLHRLGIQRYRLEGEYMRKPIMCYTNAEGCALSIEVIACLVNGSPAARHFSNTQLAA
jgi:hypothetical protein